MKPTLTAERHRFVTAGDLTLSLVKSTLDGTGADGRPVHNTAGTPADVIRKQTDGTWRFVIGNHWGTGILS